MMNGLARLEWLGALCAAGLALTPAGPGWARAIALAASFGVLPGWVIARRLMPGRGGAFHALIGVTCSPLLTAGPAAALVAVGASVHGAARTVALAVAALAAWSASAPGPRLDGTPGGALRDSTPWRVALAGTALVAAVLFANPALAWRSDGAFHAAVSLSVLRDGVPPEDPYFAGLRLLYFWGSHLWAAMWLALSPALAVWTPLVGLDLLATLGLLLGVCLFARRLGGGPAAQWAAAGLAVLGATPFAWVWYAARGLGGETHGTAELRRMMTSGVDVALGSMSVGLLHPSLVFLGDKLLVMTPFALGLALTPAFALCLIESLATADTAGGSRRGSLVGLALTTGAALFVNTVVGVALLTCGGAALVSVVLTARREPGLRRGWAALLPVALALAIPAVALSPYLASIVAGSRSHASLGVSWQSLCSLVAGGALLVPAGLAWLGRGGAGSGEAAAARVLVAPAIVLALGGLALRMSGENQSKLFNLLFLLLSAPAAMGWVALFRRLGRPARSALGAVLALAVVPTAGLLVWAYSAERGQAPESYRPPAAWERPALEWARDSLAADAVLVDPQVEVGTAATLTVTARRSLLWGGEFMARKWGYPPEALEMRYRTMNEIAQPGAETSKAAEVARRFGRPLVLVIPRGIGERFGPIAHPAGFSLIHSDSSLALYRFEGAP